MYKRDDYENICTLQPNYPPESKMTIENIEKALEDEVRIIEEGNPVDASAWESVLTEMGGFEKKMDY